MKLEDSVFLVTGGASGLGEAAARTLATAGAAVVVADINDEAGAHVAGSLEGLARFVHVDVTDAESVSQGLNAASELGILRGVVNAAGIVLAQKVLGKEGPHALEPFQRVLDVNLVGTFNVCRLAAAMMSDGQPTDTGERGVIVNTASVAAFEGQIGQAAYAASKGGIVALTLPLARELARYGIRVMAIAPGLFDTPLMGSLPQAARDSLATQVPFPPRLGRPMEYAALVRHIIENEMLNGEVIRIDGAIRMAPR